MTETTAAPAAQRKLVIETRDRVHLDASVEAMRAAGFELVVVAGPSRPTPKQ